MIADKIFPKPAERFVYDGPMPPDSVEHLKNYMKATYGLSGADALRLYDDLLSRQPLVQNQ